MAFFPANFMLQTAQEDDHQPPISLAPVMPPCTSQDFHGIVPLSGKRSMTFSGFHMCDQEAHGDDDLSDEDGSHFGGERKRRLNMEQVRTLEKNFELGNKLEPERKMQLARALGLQPRQIAIWFQNRRARWKTKQLEKDYQILKRQFDAIKADNDALQAQNHKLQAEILALKGREPTEYSINLNKETEGCCSNRSEDSSELKLDMSRTLATQDSPDDLSIHHHSTTICKALFPPPPNIRPSAAASGFAAQLFHNNSSRPDLQCLKINNNNQDHQNVKEESLANMFCGVDDQTVFWPWLEHQQFN